MVTSGHPNVSTGGTTTYYDPAYNPAYPGKLPYDYTNNPMMDEEWQKRWGKTPEGIAAMANSNPLYKPTRTSATDVYAGMQSLLPGGGAYTPVNYTPLTGLDANKYAQVQGLDDSYYQGLMDKATTNLRKQYFSDDNSILNQFQNTANQRGILGSGLELGGMNQINSDFGSKLADISGDITRQRMQQDQELALKNRDFSFGIDKTNKDIEQRNAELGLDTGFRNKEGEFELSKLGLGASLDEARSITDFDSSMYESDVNLQKVLGDKENSKWDRIAEMIRDPNTGKENRQDLLEQLYIELGLNPGLAGNVYSPDEA